MIVPSSYSGLLSEKLPTGQATWFSTSRMEELFAGAAAPNLTIEAVDPTVLLTPHKEGLHLL